jgi:hypothetical protein
MCVGTIYINVQRLAGYTESSYDLSTEYISWGSCSYIHENANAFCGESNLEDCRSCKRQGCTIIQCGNDLKKGVTESFVKLIIFNLILIKLMYRFLPMICVFLILYQIKRN